ncbi:MAG TPA: PilZ domain-containing protein [Rhodocyclaceae bacterium]|nr:PilZ domain-containing protein [Rhodocyclaceae bacterium]
MCAAARAFLRHPSDVPIDVHAQPIQGHAGQRLMDVSLGGLACRSECEMDVGTHVDISIELVSPPFQAEGEVAWCRRRNGHHEIGIRFLQREDAFAARMVEQICHIEHYRNEVMRLEGRVLDARTAAEEWISKYAADFPPLRTFMSN